MAKEQFKFGSPKEISHKRKTWKTEANRVNSLTRCMGIMEDGVPVAYPSTTNLTVDGRLETAGIVERLAAEMTKNSVQTDLRI